MFTFFIYPTAFAIETAKAGVIPAGYIPVIMAGMDFITFIGVLSFVHIKKAIDRTARFVAPVKTYDPRPRNKDGSIRWYLYRWDDGKDGSRRLMRCLRCGRLYLVQAYRLHRFSAYGDTVFEDWYAVESERQADHWNRTYTGPELERRFKPALHKTLPQTGQ